ncbi:sugar ABC transporter substrate-binding protein [Ilumatobacter coccineus]|uniref:Putative sugar ABC transporter sugar-binding protein n=1 Tax=Ilumatobacter coccineus (strain NBRC 103263 / KCTC 29153 / YM16-304) TaxID=1313172 RepID=A0A6C7E9P5_ILUCY|nr:substrate-binding domain-containing protein [Ilumatobacter coccineus]BAN03110.1 putative sugar ABC transporter sugar-binding protein [Ilumatobacter coccineus YM16-304]
MKTFSSSRRRVVTTVAITAVFGLVAGACGSDSDDPETTEAASVADTAGEETAAESEGGTIAIVSPYYSAQPATKEVVDAFTARAEADGFEVSLVDTNNDLGAVNGEIETAVSQNADFVVLGMGDPQEFGPGLDAAVEAGVPVFGLDAGAVEGVTANITSDNEFLGRESAQAMIDAIGEGGKVAIIHFDPFEPVRLRGAAARELFEAAGIEVIEDVQGDPADSTGFAKTTSLDWLNKYGEGEIDGIWAGWDASALGAFQATQEAGRTEVVVTGVDGQDFAREEVAKGENWIVTVRQDWEAIANKAVDTIQELQAGTEPSSQTIVVEGEVLTADNA